MGPHEPSHPRRRHRRLPHPGDLKTFGDWIVGWDNGRACEARALIPEGKGEGWSVLELRRGADGGAVPAVTICKKADSREDEAPSYYRLDAAHTLALVPLICVSGAYNIAINAYVIAHGRAAPATYEKVFGDDQEGASVIDQNTNWDARARRLNVGFKGRGLSDCGIWRDYAWDGRRFRFVSEQVMGECRSAMRPITTWRSTVTGR